VTGSRGGAERVRNAGVIQEGNPSAHPPRLLGGLGQHNLDLVALEALPDLDWIAAAGEVQKVRHDQNAVVEVHECGERLVQLVWGPCQSRR
jgi:hypothetical protein